jgi:hypothetical protein
MLAGAPPSPTLLARLTELNFRPVHTYGLTETNGPHTVCAWNAEWDTLPPEEQARRMARQGQGYALFDLARVVDEHMNDVPRDGESMGEVVMIGNNVAKGYFQDPEATAQAFRGGWFHSGDLGVWHPDGYIELRDRKKDIIISGARWWRFPTTSGASARRPSSPSSRGSRRRPRRSSSSAGATSRAEVPPPRPGVERLPEAGQLTARRARISAMRVNPARRRAVSGGGVVRSRLSASS